MERKTKPHCKSVIQRAVALRPHRDRIQEQSVKNTSILVEFEKRHGVSTEPYLDLYESEGGIR